MTSDLEALARRVEQLARPGDGARQALVQGHRATSSAARRAAAADRDGAAVAASLGAAAKSLEAAAAAAATFAVNAREFAGSLTHGAQGRADFDASMTSRRHAAYASVAKVGLKALVSPPMLAAWAGSLLGEAVDPLTELVSPGQGDLAGEATDLVVDAVLKAIDGGAPDAIRARMTMVQHEIHKILGRRTR